MNITKNWKLGDVRKGYQYINGEDWSAFAKVVIRLRGSKTNLEEGKSNALLISKAPEMLEALKWFVNAMSDGSLIVFTDDDQHKAVRDDNQDHINEIEALVKELE